MNPSLGALALVLSLAAYAGYLRLSARWQGHQVGWPDILTVALVLASVAVTCWIMWIFWGVPLTDWQLGIAANAASIWYFRTHGRTRHGQELGWMGSIRLVMLAMFLLFGTALLVAGVAFALMKPRLPF